MLGKHKNVSNSFLPSSGADSSHARDRHRLWHSTEVKVIIADYLMNIEGREWGMAEESDGCKVSPKTQHLSFHAKNDFFRAPLRTVNFASPRNAESGEVAKKKFLSPHAEIQMRHREEVASMTFSLRAIANLWWLHTVSWRLEEWMWFFGWAMECEEGRDGWRCSSTTEELKLCLEGILCIILVCLNIRIRKWVAWVLWDFYLFRALFVAFPRRWPQNTGRLWGLNFRLHQHKTPFK